MHPECLLIHAFQRDGSKATSDEVEVLSTAENAREDEASAKAGDEGMEESDASSVAPCLAKELSPRLPFALVDCADSKVQYVFIK